MKVLTNEIARVLAEAIEMAKQEGIKSERLRILKDLREDAVFTMVGSVEILERLLAIVDPEDA